MVDMVTHVRAAAGCVIRKAFFFGAEEHQLSSSGASVAGQKKLTHTRKSTCIHPCCMRNTDKGFADASIHESTTHRREKQRQREELDELGSVPCDHEIAAMRHLVNPVVLVMEQILRTVAQ